jgi:mannose-6-phosphate isomerase-like protein (cupin superfamily)
MPVFKVDDFEKVDKLGIKLRLVISEETVRARDIDMGVAYIEPGGSTIKHVHENSVEVYFPLNGKGKLTIADEEFDLEPGMIGYVPKNTEHQLSNPYDEEFRVLFTHAPHF